MRRVLQLGITEVGMLVACPRFAMQGVFMADAVSHFILKGDFKLVPFNVVYVFFFYDGQPLQS